MFSLMPTAISCHSVDPSGSGCRAVSSRGGWCLARSHSDLPGEVGKVGQETEGCFSKERWKGSITWSTTRTPSLFVLIGVSLVIQQECVIKQRARGDRSTSGTLGIDQF